MSTTQLNNYLARSTAKVISRSKLDLIVQLQNLKLVRISILANDRYNVQEITRGMDGEIWENITLIHLIQCLEEVIGYPFFKPWSVEDVLSQDDDLTIEQAREVLKLALENHDASIGINWEVLSHCATQVRVKALAIKVAAYIKDRQIDTNLVSREEIVQAYFATQQQAIDAVSVAEVADEIESELPDRKNDT